MPLWTYNTEDISRDYGIHVSMTYNFAFISPKKKQKEKQIKHMFHITAHITSNTPDRMTSFAKYFLKSTITLSDFSEFFLSKCEEKTKQNKT